MPDLATMLAAYAASYPNDDDRLILADWLEEHGDVRGSWLRDKKLAKLMGPNLDDPAPKLVAALGSRKDARKLLVKLGLAAVPALLEERTRRWVGDRAEIEEILEEIGSGVDGLAALIERLQSDDPREQRAALNGLAALGDRAAGAVPAILRLLKEDRESVREAALATLGKLGSFADQALIAADSELEYYDREGYSALFEAIVRRGPASPAVAVIVRALGASNYDIVESAQDSLRRLGPEVFEVVLREGAGVDSDRQSRVCSVLLGFPDADARLLAVAQDPTRPASDRQMAVATLVDHYYEEPLGPERDWLIPHLTALLDDADDGVAREAAAAVAQFEDRAADAVPGLIRLFDRGDEWLRYHVVQALTAIGPAAQVALPLIQPLVDSTDSLVQRAARQFVQRLAPPEDLANAIRAGLASPDAAARVEAVRRLHEAAEHLPDLDALVGRALADASLDVRQAAAQGLPYLRWPAGIDPLPLLRKALAHRDASIRTEVLQGLPYRPELTAALVPELLARLQKDRNAGVRLAVLGALAGSSYVAQPEEAALRAPEVLAAVLAALRDRDAEVRAAALEALIRRWRPLPPEALPDLLELARTDKGQAGSEVVHALAEQEEPPAGLLGLLRERLRLYPKSWEYNTFKALDKLGHTPTAEELPLIVRGLQEENTGFAYAAAGLLGRHGAPAVPHLVPFLAAGHPGQLRRCATHALEKIGPPARGALPALARLLAAEDFYERSAALAAIAAIATAEETVDLLRPCFRDRAGRVRQDVLEVAARLGPAALAWLPELLHLVRTEDDYSVTSDLRKAVAALAAHSPEVPTGLVAILNEAEPLARRNAVGALGALGPLAAAAVPALRALRDEAGEDERRWYEHVLGCIEGVAT